MVVSFELDGCEFVALNGGPVFKFNEAVSLAISCQNQAEVDHYWSKLTVGGTTRVRERHRHPRRGACRLALAMP